MVVVVVVLLLLMLIAIVETLLPAQGAGVSQGFDAVASSVMTMGKEEFHGEEVGLRTLALGPLLLLLSGGLKQRQSTINCETRTSSLSLKTNELAGLGRGKKSYHFDVL